MWRVEEERGASGCDSAAVIKIRHLPFFCASLSCRAYDGLFRASSHLARVTPPYTVGPRVACAARARDRQTPAHPHRPATPTQQDRRQGSRKSRDVKVVRRREDDAEEEEDTEKMLCFWRRLDLTARAPPRRSHIFVVVCYPDEE